LLKPLKNYVSRSELVSSDVAIASYALGWYRTTASADAC
jgi:hypothetical protein